MSEILFDYKIDLTTITQENKKDFKLINIDDLKRFCNGRIYIFFNYESSKKRNFILLETGIIDYILQFDNLISYIDNGNNETFTVSCDYYSNSLNYNYFKENNCLEIYEVNNALFTITCKYKDFKREYEKFRKKVLGELIVFYPELTYNKYFVEYFV